MPEIPDSQRLKLQLDIKVSVKAKPLFIPPVSQNKYRVRIDGQMMPVTWPQAGWRVKRAPLGACVTFVLPEDHIAVINQSQVILHTITQSSQLCWIQAEFSSAALCIVTVRMFTGTITGSLSEILWLVPEDGLCSSWDHSDLASVTMPLNQNGMITYQGLKIPAWWRCYNQTSSR